MTRADIAPVSGRIQYSSGELSILIDGVMTSFNRAVPVLPVCNTLSSSFSSNVTAPPFTSLHGLCVITIRGAVSGKERWNTKANGYVVSATDVEDYSSNVYCAASFMCSDNATLTCSNTGLTAYERY
jgi:hypothetical protein